MCPILALWFIAAFAIGVVTDGASLGPPGEPFPSSYGEDLEAPSRDGAVCTDSAASIPLEDAEPD